MRVRYHESSVQEVGKVTVGVAIRKGACEPDLQTAEGLVRSLLAADKIIYNTATSGQFVAGLLDRLGVSDKIKEKTIIHRTGVAVMQELAEDDSGNAIAFVMSPRSSCTTRLEPGSWARCPQRSGVRRRSASAY